MNKRQDRKVSKSYIKEEEVSWNLLLKTFDTLHSSVLDPGCGRILFFGLHNLRLFYKHEFRCTCISISSKNIHPMNWNIKAFKQINPACNETATFHFLNTKVNQNLL